MSQPQALSSKEQSLFKTVVKNYESKQYKKGASGTIYHMTFH